MFPIVGRAEMFSENFLDPTTTAFDQSGSFLIGSLLCLWSVTFVFNLGGGFLFAVVFDVEGVLPTGAVTALSEFSTESAGREPAAWARIPLQPVLMAWWYTRGE